MWGHICAGGNCAVDISFLGSVPGLGTWDDVGDGVRDGALDGSSVFLSRLGSLDRDPILFGCVCV